MIGKRSAQRGLFEADHLYLDFVGRDNFYGLLASQRDQLFRDEDFAELYCAENGRPSVPPSLLATALLLQAHDKVSDEEAKARADYDLRWKVALGLAVDQRPFAKSTLQLFRAQLILKDKLRLVFERGLAYARQSGYFKSPELRLALDTTNILGRGAAKDTYNLLADGIRQVIKALAAVEGQAVENWAAGHELGRYWASSIKGDAEIDWADAQARQVFLHGLVRDADRVLALRQTAAMGLAAEDERLLKLEAAGQLLTQLVDQDVDRSEGQPTLKQEVARDRVVSVHDPEMRHGRKSKAKRFIGHKAAIAVDVASQLITAVDVLPGNAADDTNALALVKASEVNSGVDVRETVADCAYGSGATRQEFADAQRPLIASVARHGSAQQLSKDEFRIDLDQGQCTCPAGQVTRQLVSLGYRSNARGEKQPLSAFVFDAVVCAACPQHAHCVKAKRRVERLVRLHPQEHLLQEARALQGSPDGKRYRQDRQVAEHRLARLVQLGIRQARYFGRLKTLFQLLMAATVANLTLVATQMGHTKPPKRRPPFFLPVISAVNDPLGSHLAFRLCRLFDVNFGSAVKQPVFG
jgi:transposase